MHFRRQGWALALIWALCCLIIPGTAAADTQITMEAGEWSWEAGGTSGFSGVIRTDGEDLEGASLQLDIQTRMEDSGDLVFTSLNGKKVKIRKRSDRLEADLAGGGAENTFEGEWYLPDRVDDGLAYASVNLTVFDAEGNEIGTGRLDVGDREEEAAAAGRDPIALAEKAALYLAAAGAAVWVFAIGRHLILNRRKAEKA